MRVAIAGAGPGGLACALTLEKPGICPDIYERSSRVGLNVPLVYLMLDLFQAGFSDSTLGLGLIRGITSGVMAGRAIAEVLD